MSDPKQRRCLASLVRNALFENSSGSLTVNNPIKKLLYQKNDKEAIVIS